LYNFRAPTQYNMQSQSQSDRFDHSYSERNTKKMTVQFIAWWAKLEENEEYSINTSRVYVSVLLVNTV